MTEPRLARVGDASLHQAARRACSCLDSDKRISHTVYLHLLRRIPRGLLLRSLPFQTPIGRLQSISRDIARAHELRRNLTFPTDIVVIIVFRDGQTGTTGAMRLSPDSFMSEIHS